MKRVLLPVVLLAAALALTVTGCDILGLGGPDFSADLIEGYGVSDWTFVSGFVEVDPFDDGEWSVDLYAVAAADGTDPWDLGAYDSSENSIFFSAPATEEPIKLQLKLLGDTSANQTITYYGGGVNYIIIEGWIHVQVNEAAGTATVALDVSADEIWFNGTVTVDIAPE